ncbi:MAG: hypothetical protein ACK5P5_09190 [Pseudobdellovibrionaceae bacterium]
MKTKLFVFILFFVFYSVQTFAESEKFIFLSPGQEKKIQFSAGQRIKLKTQKTTVLRAVPQGQSVLIKALKLGKGHILINEQFYSIVVVAPADLDFILKFFQAKDEFLGLQIAFRDKKIILTGTLYKLSELIQISTLQKKYKTIFENHLDVTDEIAVEVREKIQSEMLAHKLPSENIFFTKPWTIRIKAKTDFARYTNVLNLFGAEAIKDDEAIDIKPLVKVEIAVAEMKKDFKRTLGVKWPSSYSAEILADGSKRYGDLIFQADALENQGFGKVLAKPNILCRSGGEAEFLAGGEFPIKVLNYKSRDVIWKRYGVLLKIKPLADRSGRISLQLNTEISSIDVSKAVDGIPGLFTNRVSSHFDLKQSQTIALSGMFKSENQQQRQGLPWLSQIPIFGLLFSSQDYIENKSELVIFVRPSVVLREENL